MRDRRTGPWQKACQKEPGDAVKAGRNHDNDIWK